MITFNVYDRVFLVRHNGSTGTAFTIDVEGRQYLLSAHHVFKGIKTGDSIEIFRNSDWVVLDIKVVGVPSTSLDVIVLALNIVLSPSHPLPLTRGGVYIGQDVHFVGFPFGMHSTVAAKDGILHIPLVKRACLSGSIEEDGGRIWLLDGFNNPGFSGGAGYC